MEDKLDEKIKIIEIMEDILGGSVESWNKVAEIINLFPDKNKTQIKKEFTEEISNFHTQYGRLQNPLGHLFKVLAEIGNDIIGYNNAFQYDIFEPKLVRNNNLTEESINKIVNEELFDNEKMLLKTILKITEKFKT